MRIEKRELRTGHERSHTVGANGCCCCCCCVFMLDARLHTTYVRKQKHSTVSTGTNTTTVDYLRQLLLMQCELIERHQMSSALHWLELDGIGSI